MGNHRTTMFDDLRACSITIAQSLTNWDPIRIHDTLLGFQGFTLFFLCTPVFCAWTREWFEEKDIVFFLRRTYLWTNRGQTGNAIKKSWTRGSNIRNPNFLCCVLSISITNSWTKCTRFSVGSLWDRAPNFGNMYILLPYGYLIAMENVSFIVGLPIKNGDFPWLC